MQTFLPFESFTESARVLDRQRLGKQRVECLQILNALSGESKGWTKHPAVRMWRKYKFALAAYGVHVCQEWRRRGYKDTCEEKIMDYLHGPFLRPAWLGMEAFHSSHRAALLFKDFEYYKQFGWKEQPKLDYVWPDVALLQQKWKLKLQKGKAE